MSTSGQTRQIAKISVTSLVVARDLMLQPYSELTRSVNGPKIVGGSVRMEKMLAPSRTTRDDAAPTKRLAIIRVAVVEAARLVGGQLFVPQINYVARKPQSTPEKPFHAVNY
jgi:hypothetical protein